MRTFAIATFPSSVPPVGHPEHDEALIRWLLDVVPSSMRQHSVFRRHLVALLHCADAYVAGALSGVRQSYATARAELADVLPPEAIAATMKSIEQVGAELRAQADFISLMKQHHCDV